MRLAVPSPTGCACQAQRAGACAVRPCARVALAGSPTGSRRSLVLSTAFGFAAFAASWWPASAYPVDPVVARDVYMKSTSAVVSIGLFRDGAVDGSEPEAVGSGFIWDPSRRLVATNYHVVSRLVGDESLKAIASVGAVSYGVEIAGADATQDLAIIHLTGPSGDVGLPPPLPWAESKDLRVGQSVYAIGNPLNLTHTMTAGVVSGRGRSIPSPAGTTILDCIQTDAAIAGGSSGGPLLDSFGRVVGMATATFTRKGSGRSSGIGFAISADTLRRVLPRLTVEWAAGSSTRP